MTVKNRLKFVDRKRWFLATFSYSKTCLKLNLKGPEHFSAEARFPFNQGIV
jgi:hypothetical protein